MKVKYLATSCAAVLLPILGGEASAVNGLQLTGYGSKAQGMGGASIAFPQDAMAAANNPAGMAYVGDQLYLGTQALWDHTDSRNGPMTNHGAGVSFTPEIGYNHVLNEQWTIGLSNASNGAGFEYDNNIATGGSDGTKGTVITQIILPTVTYKPTPDLAIGFSLAPAVSAINLENFPGVTHDGYEFATGLGWRAGVLWRANDIWSFGAMYGSKIKMGSFDGYGEQALAGTNGALDVPEQYGVGVAVNLTPKLTLAADFLRIRWGETQFAPLFGWSDQKVRRVGLNYAVNDSWAVRAGVSYANRTFDSDDTVRNLMLVAINSKAASIGATKTFSDGDELTFGVEYTFDSPAVGTGVSAGSKVDTDLIVASVGYSFHF